MVLRYIHGDNNEWYLCAWSRLEPQNTLFMVNTPSIHIVYLPFWCTIGGPQYTSLHTEITWSLVLKENVLAWISSHTLNSNIYILMDFMYQGNTWGNHCIQRPLRNVNVSSNNLWSTYLKTSKIINFCKVFQENK